MDEPWNTIYKYSHTYLSVDKIDSWFNGSITPLDTSTKINTLRRRLREGNAEVEGRLQDRDHVWHDIHLVNALHLAASQLKRVN